MRFKLMLTVLVLFSLLCGCRDMRHEWAASTETYNRTLAALIVLRREGQIDDDAYRHIEQLRVTMRETLDKMEQYADEGDTANFDLYFDLSRRLLDQMILYKRGAETGGG